jgi:hypothetical protein
MLTAAMQYHVTGTNHQTGARMTMDVEAGNKIDAERKARAAGMDVQHAHPVKPDGTPEETHGSRRRGEDAAAPATGIHPVIKIASIVVLVAVIAWLAWGWLRG